MEVAKIICQPVQSAVLFALFSIRAGTVGPEPFTASTGWDSGFTHVRVIIRSSAPRLGRV